MRTIILFIALVFSGSLLAQNDRLVKVADYPLEFVYPQDFSVSAEGNTSWTIFDKEVGTEYYVNLYKVTDRFTADSLRYLMLNMYKQDPDVTNLQVSQVGSGSFGTKRADRCELTFSVGDARYTSISYLVYMYLNQKVNAVLFYFEIGVNNVISYAPLQDQMIMSLAYTPFNYTKYTYAPELVKIEYPDFWTLKEEEIEDTKIFITDYRYDISINILTPKDSTTAKSSAEAYRDKVRLNTIDFPAIKVKSGSAKLNGVNCFSTRGSYFKNINGVERKVLFERFFIRKIKNGKEVEYVVETTIPEVFKEYYEPINQKIKSSLVLPGELLDKK